MTSRQDIVRNWLPRYMGVPLKAFGRHVLLTNFDRYVQHMKGQLKELVTQYGPLGILWFDGQWEDTWTDDRGRDLYAYVRGLQPDIIINNRVAKTVGDKGKAGKIFVYGFDGNPAELTAIDAGTETATIHQDNVGMAKSIVDDAILVLQGQTVPKTVLIPGIVVDKSNVASYK